MFDFYVNIRLRDLLTKIPNTQKIKILYDENRIIYIGHCPIIGEIPDNIYVASIFTDIRNYRIILNIKVDKIFTIER